MVWMWAVSTCGQLESTGVLPHNKGFLHLTADPELRGIVLGSRNVRAALNLTRCLRFQDSWNHENANLRYQSYQQWTYVTMGMCGAANRVLLPAYVC